MAITACRRAAPQRPLHLIERGYVDFVGAHRAALLAFAERQLAGAAGVDPADALQDALIRLWREWKAAPDLDEAERRRHAFRLVRLASLDAIKKWVGRGSARGRVRTADIERAARGGETFAEGGGCERELIAIADAIHRAAPKDPYEANRERLSLRPALAAAAAALRPAELSIWLKTAAGATQGEVAADLGISVDTVNNLAREARDVAQPIIRHALDGAVGADERTRIEALLDGELTGYRRRVAQRHFAHCPPCQRIATLPRRTAATRPHDDGESRLASAAGPLLAGPRS